MAVTVKVKVDSKYLDKIKKLSKDKKLMTAIHNDMARRMDKYVPFYTGNLKNNLTINEKWVQYNEEYAHYMYEGIVYGPNIPVTENGIVVGFYSPRGKGSKSPKKPKQYMEYDKSNHPLATRHWDKAMLRHERKAFYNDVEGLIKERIKEL